jgi:RNA polymerase sigma-70 factor (ECF subfamily)
MHSQAENKELLYRIAQSDESAFADLFNRYCHKVNSFAFRLTHSAALAEEIVQDVFLKIWIGRASVASVEYFPSYLFTITRNHTLNILKRKIQEENATAIFGREILPTYHEPPSEVYNERERMLHHIISHMPFQQRQVYTLCHQQGLKYKEVAKLLNISKLTVKAHMQHALRAIKAHFKMAINAIMLAFLAAF